MLNIDWHVQNIRICIHCRSKGSAKRVTLSTHPWSWLSWFSWSFSFLRTRIGWWFRSERLIPKRWESGCIKVNRVMRARARVGGCGRRVLGLWDEPGRAAEIGQKDGWFQVLHQFLHQFLYPDLVHPGSLLEKWAFVHVISGPYWKSEHLLILRRGVGREEV